MRLDSFGLLVEDIKSYMTLYKSEGSNSLLDMFSGEIDAEIYSEESRIRYNI